MRFSLNLPLARVRPEGEFQSAEAAREISAAMERSRAAAVCLTDHPAPSADWLHNDPAGHDALDPFTGLAFVAASTRRIKLQTSMIVLAYRNPFITAKSAATLHVLSGRRLILGVAAGYQRTEFEALGAQFSERGALADEALETIKLAWSGGPVVKRGRYFNATGNEPRPIPSPPPPIWVGGGSDKAVERAARWGDGWAPFLSRPVKDQHADISSIKSVAELAQKIGRLRAMREELGKAAICDVSVAPPYFPKSMTRSDAEAYCESVEELASVGVTWLTVTIPARDRASFLEKLAWFSEDVMSRFDD